MTLRYVILSVKKGILFDLDNELNPIWQNDQPEDQIDKKEFTCMTLPEDRANHEINQLKQGEPNWLQEYGQLSLREVHPTRPSINGKVENVRASWFDLASSLLVAE